MPRQQLSALPVWQLPRNSSARRIDRLRMDGDPSASTLYFLPWGVSHAIGRSLGLVGADSRACYEMPTDLVSIDPHASVASLVPLLDDASDIISRTSDPVLVGLCLGNCPATLLARRHDASLISIATADRAERIIWESPAASQICQAIKKRGITQAQLGEMLAPLAPEEHIYHVHRPPWFISGRFDKIVPGRRTEPVIKRARERFGDVATSTLPLGHRMTLVVGSVHRRWTMNGRRRSGGRL
jgi:hypothetical protein